ncbi:hypothetical protein CLOSTASPAR_05908 [[Clostridium] asparagiforme DSM 15981]|uniref:Uncharacterized protein n=1 Tax=[Clostridium] asparagiforme DSM 15981 TaxID=518636 RepID=C0D9F8_9FIRM|nr:hypothetical protein CLOSTASPAR_05908 [[Clostridium] asparagiforme DSM 15981]
MPAASAVTEKRAIWENYCEEQLLIMRNDKEFYNGKPSGNC